MGYTHLKWLENLLEISHSSFSLCRLGHVRVMHESVFKLCFVVMLQPPQYGGFKKLLGVLYTHTQISMFLLLTRSRP